MPIASADIAKVARFTTSSIVENALSCSPRRASLVKTTSSKVSSDAFDPSIFE